MERDSTIFEHLATVAIFLAADRRAQFMAALALALVIAFVSSGSASAGGKFP